MRLNTKLQFPISCFKIPNFVAIAALYTVMLVCLSICIYICLLYKEVSDHFKATTQHDDKEMSIKAQTIFWPWHLYLNLHCYSYGGLSLSNINTCTVTLVGIIKSSSFTVKIVNSIPFITCQKQIILCITNLLTLSNSCNMYLFSQNV